MVTVTLTLTLTLTLESRAGGRVRDGDIIVSL
jgi:hypothetical protein